MIVDLVISKMMINVKSMEQTIMQLLIVESMRDCRSEKIKVRNVIMNRANVFSPISRRRAAKS